MVSNSGTMKGVRVLRDVSSNKGIIQIDIEAIDPTDEMLEDFVDVILAEEARNDEMIPWEKAKAMLKIGGK